MFRNDTICSSTHETYTAASVVLVETSIKEYGNGHSMLVTPKTTFELVVTPSEHFKGQITSACEYNKNNFHRCLKTGLGWNVRKSCNSREMVPFRKRETHQLAGMGSSNFDSKYISATVEAVLVRSDNASVVQYIVKEGGISSPQLCYKAWEL